MITAVYVVPVVTLLLPPYLFWVRPQKRRLSSDLLFVAVVAATAWHLLPGLSALAGHQYAMIALTQFVLLIATALFIPQYILWKRTQKNKETDELS